MSCRTNAAGINSGILEYSENRGGIGTCQSQRKRCVLALDQGTTSSRAILFDEAGATACHKARNVSTARSYAWRWRRMEEEPTKRLSNMTQKTSGEPRSDVQASAFPKPAYAPKKSLQSASQISGKQPFCGTRSTGKPVAPAIVWQSRVSAPICERLKG